MIICPTKFGLVNFDLSMRNPSYIFLFSALVFLFSCKKDKINTDSDFRLQFSVDIVMFDTVFTTIGSTTQRLKVFNTSKSLVTISSIQLDESNGSQFRINVDGFSGNVHKNIEINAEDSIYIFVEVTVDPNDELTPFVIEDRLRFITNGNTQHVELVAWGQNAHYFTPNRKVTGLPDHSYLDREDSDAALNITWTNDKPYVIYGYLIIDGDDKLTIEKGVNVHLHNSAGIWVYQNGNIRVNGTQEEPVTFQGTRLEAFYDDIPGQWDRLWINEGNEDNVFNHAIIKNAFIGIQAETLPFEPLTVMSNNRLRLNNCKIQNAAAAGILATNYQITDTNSIITNFGQYSLLVTGGGNYDFYHTNLTNYWTGGTRNTPLLYLQNFYLGTDNFIHVRDINANFYNCIIHGNVENEFGDTATSGGTVNYTFDHCLIKTTQDTDGNNFVNIEKFEGAGSSIFMNINTYDFHPITDSPVIDKGKDLMITTDHEGKTRNNPPDIGALEN